MLREFFLGFIKVHILHHAAEAPIYGLAMIAELRRHGYTLSPGTLYPILHSLDAVGYLRHDERIVGGKVRKYYTITTSGQQALAETRDKVREVLEGDGPRQLSEPTDSEDEGVSDPR